jgi:hypothetical protein
VHQLGEAGLVLEECLTDGVLGDRDRGGQDDSLDDLKGRGETVESEEVDLVFISSWNCLSSNSKCNLISIWRETVFLSRFLYCWSDVDGGNRQHKSMVAHYPR